MSREKTKSFFRDKKKVARKMIKTFGQRMGGRKAENEKVAETIELNLNLSTRSCLVIERH